MSGPLEHLTEGWPPDPDNADLAHFAEQLRAARPEMSEDSLQRIGQAVRKEIVSRHARRKRWAVGLAAAAAAAVLITLALVRDSSPPAPPPSDGAAQTQAAEVHDSCTVELAPPRAPAPERPPLQLEDHQSLFTQ